MIALAFFYMFLGILLCVALKQFQLLLIAYCALHNSDFGYKAKNVFTVDENIYSREINKYLNYRLTEMHIKFPVGEPDDEIDRLTLAFKQLFISLLKVAKTDKQDGTF